MRITTKAAVSAVTLSVALLAGCASPGAGGGATTSATGRPSGAAGPAVVGKPQNKPEDLKVLDTITVNGTDPAKTPTAQFAKTPVVVSSTTVKVLREGSGPESTSRDAVSVKQTLFIGKDGKQLDSNYEDPQGSYFRLGSGQTIPGLLSALTGVRAGSRILFAIPPAEAFGPAGRKEAGIGPGDDLVVVADILSVTTPLGSAQGTAVPPVPGHPTVTFDAAAGPATTVPQSAPPTDMVSQVLVQGAGREVKQGQTVVAHYTGVLWKDGSTFDSSWQRKEPIEFALGSGGVIPAWDKGLTGKTVGSRVLLIVPPKDGYGDKGSPPKIAGTDTLVFVIDILDAA